MTPHPPSSLGDTLPSERELQIAWGAKASASDPKRAGANGESERGQTPRFLIPLSILQRGWVSRILRLMEIHFTPEQEAQLTQIATLEGTEAERLVRDAAVRLLAEDARFRAAVREGITQADRGEFIEEEMNARFERMLQS